MKRFLPRLERYLTQISHYLCSNEPTIADVSFAPLAAQAKQLDISLKDYPLVTAYVDRLLARPAWQSVQSEVMKAVGR